MLEVLRDAPEPQSGRALAQAVVASKGLEDSRDVLAVVQKTALAVPRRLVTKGEARRWGDGERHLRVGAWLSGEPLLAAFVALPIAAPVAMSPGAGTFAENVTEDLAVTQATSVFA